MLEYHCILLSDWTVCKTCMYICDAGFAVLPWLHCLTKPQDGPSRFSFLFPLTSLLNTRGKVLSWEYISLRKRNSRPPASVILCWVSWVEKYYLFIMRQVICWFVFIGNRFVYIGKNPRFTFFLHSNLYTRLAIVTENKLGLAFPPRNLPKKFLPDPSTFYLVIMVTNKQTDKPTLVIT